ncbi:hypothetical protein NE452_01845 [Paeniclostridium sordellii]|uniref:hypothetical protein n=1 Tax=Paraclostridium sordellii TaxID=1505 RepID=UPI00210EC142|nr:hypothetical protein [Paeniclostridium sordellii]MCQ4696252.1 hypothetical protein [Paeniclostridium sordellii]
MQQEYTNVIGRLYELVVKLRNSSTNNSDEAFAEVFDIDSKDNVQIFLCYSNLFRLCDESISLIDKYYPNKPSLKKHIENTMKALSKIEFNGYNGMNNFNSYLTSDTLTGLETISLIAQCTEKTLSDDKLSELSKDINSMLDDILKSNMNESLKCILSDRLIDILKILKNYEIYGSEKVVKSIESSIGAIYLNQPNIKNDSEKNLCKDILLKLTSFVTFLSDSVPLIEYIEKLLS